MTKVIIICGLTATGKTNVGLLVAKKINGELISADSRQIYTGMDIGTGKDLPVDAKHVQQRPIELTNAIGSSLDQCTVGYHTVGGIRIWLYDIIEPVQQLSSALYALIARGVVSGIVKRGKVPIVVGGSGFYISTLINGILSAGIPRDPKLRKKLQSKSITQLKEHLQDIDPARFKAMNNSDQNNPYRLVRAIEIAQHTSSSKKSTNPLSSPLKHTPILFGLFTSQAHLNKLIERRVKKRVERGVKVEIKELFQKGYGWSDPGLNTMGYKEWKANFDGQISQEVVIQQWIQHEQAYANRQLTWFKKDKRIKWFSIEKYKPKQLALLIADNVKQNMID